MDKRSLRKHLRDLRRGHVDSLDPATRALVFHRPPARVLKWLKPGAMIGLYAATTQEAPTAGYASFLHENGYLLALPYFADRDAHMEFARWENPWLQQDEAGPFGARQPDAAADRVVPDAIFVPLLGFTSDGDRLGQGGGHYDRWLATHVGTPAFGLAWDVQLLSVLPVEPHDRKLDAVITPTRLYGPFR